MTDPLALIEMLADGQVHSGSELAEKVGVSRTAVWKQIARLEAFGVDIETIPRVGYRLPSALELLDESFIRSVLISKGLVPDTLNIYQSIPSTNATLLSSHPSESLQIAVAEHQTAGRGRRGRAWVSPYGKNLYFSIRKDIASGLSAYEGLSLAVGVVVVECLKHLGATGLSLKWPNDILLDGKKLGGILIEVAGDPSGQCHIVVGVGINLATSSLMTEKIDQPWNTLNNSSTKFSRNQLLGNLLVDLSWLLNQFESQGFAFYRDRWQNLNAYTNQEVVAVAGNQQIKGTVTGIDTQGALILETAEGRKYLHGGEISLRVFNCDS